MKKSLLIAMFLGIVLLHAKAQNSNSDISAPVVIDTQNPLSQRQLLLYPHTSTMHKDKQQKMQER